MLKQLKRLYRGIGIHAAPRGTVLYYIHRSLFHGYVRIYSTLAKLLPAARAASFVARQDPPFPVPHWYRIVVPRDPAPFAIKEAPLHFREVLKRDEHAVFDLDWAVNHDHARGVALVFFMGMGDYLFTTPLIAEIKRRYSNIPLYAYISSTADSNNSPLVGKLMEYNKDIDKIFYYRGAKDSRLDISWKNYDYDDVFNLAPKEFLVVPVIYEYVGQVRHRVLSLFDTFLLPRPDSLPRPIIHLPATPSERTGAMVAGITKQYADHNCRRIVFLHLDQRSSGYSYPYADLLAQELENLGCLVVSFSTLGQESPKRIAVDIKATSIVELIHALRMVHRQFSDKVSMITVSSIFWSVSAGLGIPNLGIQQFYDERIHTTWYENTHVIARHQYPTIPAMSISVAPEADITSHKSGHDDISVGFITQCAHRLWEASG